uniref:Uncharacterized protein n=1 Tax=Picea sitchensis TaxID=3332 RepID=B8LPE3_PICSI|nr:unknown [Picea sitchensis]
MSIRPIFLQAGCVESANQNGLWMSLYLWFNPSQSLFQSFTM